MSFGIKPLKKEVADRIKKYKDPLFSSKLGGVWVKITSGAGKSENELVSIISNPKIPTFGQRSIHGSLDTSAPVGTMGFSGDRTTDPTSQGLGYYPRPIIDSIQVTNGNRGLSKKASFTIKCYTKEQVDEIAQYFLEPGFHVCIEWGWNQTESYGQICKDVNDIAALYKADTLDNKRSASNYTYDVYLGVTTGGGITTSDGSFDVSVELTGISEILSHLQFNASTTTDEDGTDTKTGLSIIIQKKGIVAGTVNFAKGVFRFFKNFGTRTSTADTQAISTGGTHSFAYMFNDLPASWRTANIMNLINDETGVAHPGNYLNFIPDVAKDINKATKSRWWIFNNDVEVEGETHSIPSGAGILDTERYIRFGTLMDILRTVDVNMELKTKNENTIITPNINTSGVLVTAFPRIFSTNPDRLYIPNPSPLDFGLSKAFSSTEAAPSFSEYAKGDDPKVGRVDERSNIEFVFNSIPGFPSNDNSKDYDTDSYDLKVHYFGYLDALYINFDFVKGILERQGLSVRDMLLEMLNGMSSAVNNIWNFQVTEEVDDEKGTFIISIVEENFLGLRTSPPPSFISNGEQSSFLSFNLDMDLPAAMTSQIMAKRLTDKEISKETNIPNRLFIDNIDIKDQILIRVPWEAQESDDSQKDDRDEKDKIKDNFEFFMKTATLISDIVVPNTEPSSKIDEYIIVAAFNDTSLFNHFNKIGHDNEGLSVLLPITCKFSTYGVSGILFNNTFSIGDISSKYQSDKGIFQVRELSHTISGMDWIVEVEGQFRQIPG